MKWLLVALVLGEHPVDTGLLYETLVECYDSQLAASKEIGTALSAWRESETEKYVFGPRQTAAIGAARLSLGAENTFTCIPHR